jgi:hypothetical protein
VLERILHETRISQPLMYDIVVGESRLCLYGAAESFRDLRRFFPPYYAVTPAAPCPGEADVRVFAVLRGRGHPGRLEERMLSYLERPRGRVRNDKIVYIRRAVGSVVVADPSQRTVYVFSATRRSLDLSLRTIVRDQLIERIERGLGCISFHGAVVADPDGAVVFSGERGSGKTTAMLTRLAAGSHFVSGDRCRLFVLGGNVWVRGTPNRCNVFAESLRSIPSIRRKIDSLSPGDDSGEKLLVDPHELTSAFRVGILPAARVKAIVFPRLTVGHTRAEVRVIGDTRTIRSLLKKNLLEQDHCDSVPDWLDLLPAHTDSLTRRLEDVAERITSARVVMIEASRERLIEKTAAGAF